MARLDVLEITGLHPRVARSYWRLQLTEGEQDREVLSKSRTWCNIKRSEIEVRLGRGEDEEMVWKEVTESESREVNAREAARKRVEANRNRD